MQNALLFHTRIDFRLADQLTRRAHRFGIALDAMAGQPFAAARTLVANSPQTDMHSVSLRDQVRTTFGVSDIACDAINFSLLPSACAGTFLVQHLIVTPPSSRPCSSSLPRST